MTAAPALSSEFQSDPSQNQYGASQMKKSCEINCYPSPDYMERAWLDFLNRNFRSNEEAAVHFDVTESTIRNWKAMGLTRAALRILNALGRNPELRSSLFGGDR